MTFDMQDLKAQVAKLNEHFLNDSGLCVYCYNVGLKNEFCDRNPYSVLGRNLESVFKHIDSKENKLRILSQEMDSSSTRAIKMWREETGKDCVWPDRTELIKWLLDQLETATQERDQARKYGSAAYTISVMCEALDHGGVSASKLAEMLSQPLSEMRTAGIQRVANALFDACHGEVYADELETAKETIKLLSEREPTQKEADHARSSAAGGTNNTGDNECFVQLGGWTSRRCADCNKWVFGGPTRCSICVAISDPH